MTFHAYGDSGNPRLLLIPGLGVSHEIFLPLIGLLKDKYYIIATGIDGFLIGRAFMEAPNPGELSRRWKGI